MSYESTLTTDLATTSTAYSETYRLITVDIPQYCLLVGFAAGQIEELEDASYKVVRRKLTCNGLPDIVVELRIPIGYLNTRNSTLTLSAWTYLSDDKLPTKTATGLGKSLVWTGGAAFTKETLFENIYKLLTNV